MFNDNLSLNELIQKAIFPGIRQIIKEELSSQQNTELQARYLSEREARQLFKTPPTRQTFINWENKGLIQSYMIGGRKYYIYGEIIAAVETIKKYSRDKVKNESVAN